MSDGGDGAGVSADSGVDDSDDSSDGTGDVVEEEIASGIISPARAAAKPDARTDGDGPLHAPHFENLRSNRGDLSNEPQHFSLFDDGHDENTQKLRQLLIRRVKLCKFCNFDDRKICKRHMSEIFYLGFGVGLQ
jgi:hypothetical protein